MTSAAVWLPVLIAGCLGGCLWLWSPVPGHALDAAVEVSGRTDRLVEAQLRVDAGSVTSVYAGRLERWRNREAGHSHRVGVSTPTAVVGPVSEGRLLAQLSRPDELVANPKEYLWSRPLSMAQEPSPETDFGVLVRAGPAFAVVNAPDRTTASLVVGPTPRAWKRIGLVATLGASWPAAAAAPAEWFPESVVSDADELYHAAGAVSLSPAVMNHRAALVGVASASAGHTLRPGTAASVHLFGAADGLAVRLAGARVGADYTAPDGSTPAGRGAGPRYRAEGELDFERSAPQEARRLGLQGAVTAQEVAGTFYWLERSAELEWRGPRSAGDSRAVLEAATRVRERSDGSGEIAPSVTLSGASTPARLAPRVRARLPVEYELTGRRGHGSAGARDPTADPARKLTSLQLILAGKMVLQFGRDLAGRAVNVPLAAEIGFNLPVTTGARAAAQAADEGAGLLTTLEGSIGADISGREPAKRGLRVILTFASRGRPERPLRGAFWGSYRLTVAVSLRAAGL